MKQSQPKISVVIPLYNKGRYVEHAIKSILESGFPVHEVIVVDDGSADGGGRRVSALGDARVRLITQPNRGAAAARNRGITEATGDYLAFLDADDCWTPEYLPCIADLIARFPECGMYATHFYFFRDDGFREVPRLWGFPDTTTPQRIERFFEIWSHSIPFCTDSVVIATRTLRDSGIVFPEGEQLGEDQDVWFRVAERTPIGYLPQPLAGYRQGVSGSLMTASIEDFQPYIRRLAARYRANAIPQQHRKGVSRLLSVSRIQLARNLLLAGKRRRAIGLLYHPSCLRAPRYWLRLFLAAHLPSPVGRRIIG